ncbi:MAG: amidohydrolase family protein [Hyphomicrobiaceae bacterium]
MTGEDDDLPIIDAHHHFWDIEKNYHPWLCDEPMIPFRYGDYSAIRKPFMPADYAEITGPHNVVANVTMEGEWDESDPVGETQWMAEVAEEFGTPAAHVARAFLDRKDAVEVLTAHATCPLVRGIRHKPAAAPRRELAGEDIPGSMRDPAWRNGYAELAAHGLHFELQTPWYHIDDLLDLTDRYPETPVVINHGFMPPNRALADKDVIAAWKKAVRRAAAVPHFTTKISGIGIPGRSWQLEDHMSVIYTLLEAFDVDRAMFASNFPVDGLCGSFETIYAGYKQSVADISRSDRIKLFHDNAIRIYSLDLETQA